VRGIQFKLPPPAAEMLEALQNVDSSQDRLEELGGFIPACTSPNFTYPLCDEGSAAWRNAAFDIVT
jgi:hypothetical protein